MKAHHRVTITRQSVSDTYCDWCGAAIQDECFRLRLGIVASKIGNKGHSDWHLCSEECLEETKEEVG